MDGDVLREYLIAVVSERDWEFHLSSWSRRMGHGCLELVRKDHDHADDTAILSCPRCGWVSRPFSRERVRRGELEEAGFEERL